MQQLATRDAVGIDDEKLDELDFGMALQELVGFPLFGKLHDRLTRIVAVTCHATSMRPTPAERVQQSQYDDGCETTDSHWVDEVEDEANGTQGSI